MSGRQMSEKMGRLMSGKQGGRCPKIWGGRCPNGKCTRAQTAEREVKKLAAALARNTGKPDGEAAAHLWGRLGVLLQRGNAALLGNRVPAPPDAAIDGII